MLAQITNAGLAKLNSGDLSLASYQLGSGSNYTPSAAAVALYGTVVHTGVPSGPLADTPSLLRYSITLDYETGPFPYGEVGLFSSDGTLVVLLVSDTLIYKDVPDLTSVGESQRIDLYLSVTGSGYNAWVAMAESSNEFQLAVLDSVDFLPPSLSAIPNAYLVSSETVNQDAFLAYTDRFGLWSFDAYGGLNDNGNLAIQARSQTSVRIARSSWDTNYFPAYEGKTILQFSTGALQGTCRYVTSATVSADGQSVVLGLSSVLQTLPTAGDHVRLLSRNALSVSNVALPIATETTLGAFKLGDTLSMSIDGTLNVDPTSDLVQSVAGRTGEIKLTANDIEDLPNVAKTGEYLDLKGIPEPLGVASASLLGGVRLPAGGDFTASESGDLHLAFVPVKNVNGVMPSADGTLVFNVDYSGSHGTVGEFSSTKEFSVDLDRPAAQMHLIDSFPLGMGRTSDFVLQVLQYGQSIEVQASKLMVAISGDKVLSNEYAIVSSGARFPFSVNLANDQVQLYLDATNLNAATTSYYTNAPVDLSVIGIPNGNYSWKAAKRRIDDPIFALGVYKNAPNAPVKGVLADKQASNWTYDSSVDASGLKVLAAAYGNGIWLGITQTTFVTSADREAWTVIGINNPIYQWLQASGEVLTGDEVLVFNSARSLFTFASAINGITFESPDGSNWVVASVQLPISTTNPATVQFIPGSDKGFFQLAKPQEGEATRLQILGNGMWNSCFMEPRGNSLLAFAFNEDLNAWLFVYNNLDGGDGGFGMQEAILVSHDVSAILTKEVLGASGSYWTHSPSSQSLGDNVVSAVIAAKPRTTNNGEIGAFWVLAENSTVFNYVSVVVSEGTTRLVVSGIRNSLV